MYVAIAAFFKIALTVAVVAALQADDGRFFMVASKDGGTCAGKEKHMWFVALSRLLDRGASNLALEGVPRSGRRHVVHAVCARKVLGNRGVQAQGVLRPCHLHARVCFRGADV